MCVRVSACVRVPSSRFLALVVACFTEGKCCSSSSSKTNMGKSNRVQPTKKARTGDVGGTGTSDGQVPSAAEIGTLFAPNRLGGSVQSDDAKLTFMPYCNEGTIYGAQFSSGKLVVLFLCHGTKPSVWYQFFPSLQKFIQMKKEKDEECPDTLADFEQSYGMKIVMTGKKERDDDQIGFVPFLLAIYVNEDMAKNVVMLLDEFVSWRAKTTDEDLQAFSEVPKLLISVPLTFEININDEDDMECPFEILKEKDSGMSVFDAMPPCFPNRIVVATFEMLSEDSCSVIFSGNTKPFQRYFEEEQIAGKSVKKDPSQMFGEYYRVIPSLKLDNAEKVDWLLGVIGEKVLRNSPVQVRLKDHNFPGNHLNVVVERLREMGNTRVAL